MRWVQLFLQLLSLRQGFLDTRAVTETAHAMAARGKRFAGALVAFALAGLFFFSGFMLAVVELGLQIDRGIAPAYSGLMVSSTLLLGICVCFALLGMLLNRKPPAPPAPPPPPVSPLRGLLEEFLVSFLSQLKTPTPPQGKSRE